jgi:hypothetical protein
VVAVFLGIIVLPRIEGILEAGPTGIVDNGDDADWAAPVVTARQTGGSIAPRTTTTGRWDVASTAGKPAKKTTAKTKATPKETTKARARRRRAPTEEAIAKRAYELSLADGDGDDVARWLQAERELSAS